jgi:hypothetical protein
MWLDTIIFDNKQIENEQIKLAAKDGLYYLGPNLTLRNCNLILRVPTKRLLIPGARLIDCTIEVKTELKNFRWFKAFLKGCRFKGRLTGCDFGRWPDSPEEGGIEDCDFSAAQLDGCRFIGCDASTLKFPPWPYFTLLDPVRRLEELRKVPWPGQVGALVEILADSPLETSAVTISATTFGETWGASEAEIRAALEHLDGVKY